MHLLYLTLTCLMAAQVAPLGPAAATTTTTATNTEQTVQPEASPIQPADPLNSRLTEAPPWKAGSAQPTPPSPPAISEEPDLSTPAVSEESAISEEPSISEESAISEEPAISEGLPSTATSATEPGRGILPIRSGDQRLTPERLLAEILSAPVEGPLSGRSLRLVEALSSRRNRAQRLHATLAYWQSIVSAGEYRIARDRYNQLDRISAGAAKTEILDKEILDKARTTARTLLQAARLAAVAWQHRLAEAVRLAPGSPLPLPADLPHVGTYQTRFDEIFASRPPTATLRLIHRTLPIRYQVIGVRAAAVEAAEEVLLATNDAYTTGQTGLPSLLSAVDALAQQRQVFLQAVYRYNQDIADYALTIAGLQTTGRSLVATLIELDRQSSEPKPSGRDSSSTDANPDFEQAGYLEPIPLQPTLAPPRDSIPATEPDQPAASNWPPVPDEEDDLRQTTNVEKPTRMPPMPTESMPTESMPTESIPTAAMPTGTPPIEPNQPGRSAAEDRLLVPVEPVPPEPVYRTANRLPLDSEVPFAPAMLYPTLVDTQAAVQAKHLAAALQWRPAEADNQNQPIELADCLDGRQGRDAHAIIAAYWVARQRAGVYQADLDRTVFLGALVPITLERTSAPYGAEAMLTLRAARLAADAQLLEARLRLLESQFELTQAAGRPLDSAWLLPATPPHAGPYKLKLDAQPSSLAESWPLRRLAVTIPALAESLQRRATAVVQADVHRAEVTAAYQAGQPDVAIALAAIQRQTEQTLGFLDAVTAYNLSIADYVTAVLPAAIPAEQLVATLVVVR